MTPALGPDLTCLLRPRSVAVLGASQARGKHGNTALRYLKRSGYSGSIHVVNPNATMVEDVPSVPSVNLLPHGLDCAFLAIPAASVVDAIADCARQGIRAAVIAASGFAETGTEEGRQRQEAVAEIARRAGMRILGPNTNGFINNRQGVLLGYNTSHGEDHRLGSISIASQSGAVLNTIARSLAEHSAGLAHFVTVGNEVDVTLEDLLAYYIEDASTTVIGMIVESVSDVRRFTELAEEAWRRGKPIVALKLGRSAAGAAAALAHSSRLAGQSRAYDALFSALRIQSVHSIETFAASLAVLEQHPIKAGVGVDTRVVCVATSGGGAALTVDAAVDAGLSLAGPHAPDWTAATAATASDIQNGHLQNPLDLSALGSSWEPLSRVFMALESCGFIGPVIAFSHIAARPQQDDRLFRALSERRTRTTAPVCVLSPGGLRSEIEDRYRAANVFVFHHTETLMTALGVWSRTAPALNSAPSQPARGAEPLGQMSGYGRQHTILSEIDSTEALRQVGVPIVQGQIIDNRAALALMPSATGFPLVLKGIVPGVAHKAAQGLVRLDIGNQSDLTSAYDDLEAAARAVSDQPLRVLAQPQVKGDLELILGVSEENGLGYFFLVGLGGIYTEAMDMSVLIPLSASVEMKRDLLVNSRVGALISSLRGYGPGTVINELIDIGERLRNFVTSRDGAVVSIDLNPVLVRRDGCVAVDALIVLKRDEDD